MTMTDAEIKAYKMRLYRKANPEKIKAYTAQWQKDNVEKRREYARKYYAANKAKLARKVRAWQKANCDRVLVSVKKWQAANPEKIKASKRAYYLRRKARIAQAFAALAAAANA